MSLRTLALLLIMAAGCSESRRPPPVAERVDTLPIMALDGGLPDAPPCRFPALADTAGWRQAGSSGLRLLLPPSFRPDAERAGQFIHGGRAWRAGALRFEEVRGQWSRSSFRDAPGGTECRARVAGSPALVMEHVGREGYSLTVWLAGAPGDVHDPVLGGYSPDPRDRAMLLTVIQTARSD